MAAMLKSTMLALGLALLCGGATGAQAEAAKADGAKRVCKNIRPTGSRLSTRICKSADEWQRETDKTQQMVMDGNLRGSRRDGEFNVPH